MPSVEERNFAEYDICTYYTQGSKWLPKAGVGQEFEFSVSYGPFLINRPISF